MLRHDLFYVPLDIHHLLQTTVHVHRPQRHCSVDRPS